MRPPDSLYRLIKSLNKAEKANFKKFASKHVIGGKNKYILLFDAVARSNKYDEDDLKRKFSSQKFVTNFPVIKNYLYETILNSLTITNTNSGTDDEIKNEIRYVEVLFKKGLFKDCKRILDRALKKAYRYESFQLILKLLKWKKNLINERVYQGNQFAELERTHYEESEIINKLKNLSDYRYLSYRARSLIVGPANTENAKRELMKILNEPLLSSEKKALSYNAHVSYCHTLAAIYESMDKNVKALHYRKRLLAIMEENPEKLSKKLPNYIVSVYNLLGTCFNLKKYVELLYFIKKLRSIDKFYRNKISDSDSLMICVGSSIYELRMHISNGSFGKLDTSISEIETAIEKYDELILKTDKLYLYYLLCYSYFGRGDIIKALSWVNRILNDKEINHETSLYVTSRIINLIIHYELGNFELLDYLIRSTYIFLKKKKHRGFKEQIIIEFMKKLPEISSKAQLINLFKESLKQLKSYDRSGKEDDNLS